MADYVATVPSSWSQEATFDYLADFRTVAEWDPSMQSAVLLSGQAGCAGARYRLTMSVAGTTRDFDYEAVQVDRPRQVVLQSESSAALLTDTIRVTEDGQVTYHANVELKGIRKVADPVIELLLHRVSDRAKVSLRDRLTTPAP